MATAEIQPERIRALNELYVRGGVYVLYWMQQSQRAEDNHALEYAIQRANVLGLPVLVGFGIKDDYPEANERHYRFMIEGLAATSSALRRRGISFTLQRGSPDEVAIRLAKKAAVIVCDRGYQRHQKLWRENVARDSGREVVQVESDVVVPVNVASNKREYAARTIRPRIHRALDDFMVNLRTTPVENKSTVSAEGDLDPSDTGNLLKSLKLDRSVGSVSSYFEGGTSQGKAKLRALLREGIDRYSEERNHPELETTSHLSPYLHFGQVSPVWAALAVRDSDAPREEKEKFLEELIVRRELGANFVNFEPEYDSWSALPEWARRTLEKHEDDVREHVYTKDQLAAAETHDPYWNAAMTEMKLTGYMHNYMRMYWGKKIIEWTNTPRYAHQITLELNNRYFLDGRDCSSFSNVGWIFGLHDRPWQEREIFGTIRYITRGGLERKFDIEGYVNRIALL